MKTKFSKMKVFYAFGHIAPFLTLWLRSTAEARLSLCFFWKFNVTVCLQNGPGCRDLFPVET